MNVTNYETTKLRNAGETIILIGAIISTVMHVMLIFLTFFIWTIFAAVFIPLIWVTRHKVMKNSYSRGWNIFGIVMGAIFNPVELIGYTLILIDESADDVINTNIIDENNNYE